MIYFFLRSVRVGIFTIALLIRMKRNGKYWSEKIVVLHTMNDAVACVWLTVGAHASINIGNSDVSSYGCIDSCAFKPIFS